MKLSDLVKLIFCALGHTIIFLFFLFFLAEGQLGAQSPKVFNFPLFFEVSTNVYRINLLVYIPFALLLYGIWFTLQFSILHRFRHFTIAQFLVKKFTRFYLILCGAGYLNLVGWIIGMEGNVFGFIFALPEFIISLIFAFMEIRIFFQQPPSFTSNTL